MYARTDTDLLHTAVAEAADLVDIACSRDRVRPVLTAFPDAITAPIVFNVVTSGGRIKDLSFDFMVPPGDGDPYPRALAHGLAEETDHPVRSLFSDIQAARFPVQSYGVDYRINAGFSKTYVFFPLGGLQSVGELADLPSMPRGLSERVDTFTDFGLHDKVSALAIDYTRRTWNVYVNGLSADHVERAAVLAMLREFGLPEPSEQLLDFIATSSALYPTFGWDSPKIERISFSTRTTDPAALPTRIEPALEKFARSVPYTYDGDRVLVYAGALSHGEEYYKLAAYHQMASQAHDRVRRAAN